MLKSKVHIISRGTGTTQIFGSCDTHSVLIVVYISSVLGMQNLPSKCTSYLKLRVLGEKNGPDLPSNVTTDIPYNSSCHSKVPPSSYLIS